MDTNGTTLSKMEATKSTIPAIISYRARWLDSVCGIHFACSSWIVEIPATAVSGKRVAVGAGGDEGGIVLHENPHFPQARVLGGEDSGSVELRCGKWEPGQEQASSSDKDVVVGEKGGEDKEKVMISGKCLIDAGKITLVKGENGHIIFLPKKVAEKNIVLDFEFARCFIRWNQNQSPFVCRDCAIKIKLFSKIACNKELFSPVRVFFCTGEWRESTIEL